MGAFGIEHSEQRPHVNLYFWFETKLQLQANVYVYNNIFIYRN